MVMLRKPEMAWPSHDRTISGHILIAIVGSDLRLFH